MLATLLHPLCMFARLISTYNDAESILTCARKGYEVDDDQRKQLNKV